MGLTRLSKSVLAGVIGIAIACTPLTSVQATVTTPNTSTYAQKTPFTQIDNDLIVGSMGGIQGGALPGIATTAANLWVQGTMGMQATGTGTHYMLMQPISTLGQETTLTFPDAGAATDTVATLGASQTFTGTNTFPSVGLTGTSHNITLQALAAVGQASTVTVPDPGATTANVLLDAGTNSAVTIQHVAVALTSANITGMYATPVQLIAAPATGKTIVVNQVKFEMTSTSTTYTAGGVVVFQYGNAANGAGTAATNTVAASVVNDAAAETTETVRVCKDATASAATGLFVSNQTQAFATGTGTAVVDIWYSIK